MSQTQTFPKMDALLPPEMAAKAEEIGSKKAQMDIISMLLLSVLAGLFIAMGAEFYTIVATGTKDVLPFGLTKLLGGLAFSLGLILVVVAGAELFTGNNLIVMSLASGRIGVRHLLRNWVVVYLGNFIGSVIAAYLLFYTRQYAFADGAVGATAVGIATAKCELNFVQALFLGIYCNALVCLAVWLCFSARTSTDKVLLIVFPITAFVASGFEHCVANMYFIPMGMLIAGNASAMAVIGADPAAHSALTMGNFLWRNLFPVTLGNIIGGAGLVGVMYWIVYSRRNLTDRRTLRKASWEGEAGWQVADGAAVEEGQGTNAES